MRSVHPAVALLVLALGACGGDPDGRPEDAGSEDAAIEDAASTDAAGEPDAGGTDAGPPDTAPPPGTWTVDVVDVGTGLAVFVRGHDFTLLYDGGSNDDLRTGADNRVLAYLKATAPELAHIDHVILSHPHRDHVELLPDVFARYAVREVWDSGAVNTICGYRAFLQAVADEPEVTYHTALSQAGEHAIGFDAQSCYGDDLPAADVRLVHGAQILRGTEVALGASARMIFLHADGLAHGGRFNENSLVVRLELGTSTILFTGDAEGGLRETWPAGPLAGSVEDDLIACCAEQLHADVLIAGHHGSKTSSRSSFLDTVAPVITVISSGPRQYGSVQLPDAEVAEELGKRGEVFRTDLGDSTCPIDAAKIGPDADGKPGGCDNVRVTVTAGQAVAEYFVLQD